jgi:tRNA dimethylallyltransferase
MTGRHIALVGTTASGKSSLALGLARQHHDLEIVSIDSMQVYRGMDIGTAKPTREERAEVPHHLIDLVDPDDDFTVARFQRAFVDALAGIEARGHRALLVGGTGLYLRAAIDGLTIPGQYPEARQTLDDEPTEVLHQRLVALDPAGATRVTATNRRRIVRALEVTIGSGRPFSSFGPGLETYPSTPFRLVGVAMPADVIAARIEARYRRQLDDGFVDEVRGLLARSRGLSRTAGQALGYKELASHIAGETTLDQAIDEAIRRTRQFARRQKAWFRRDPRIDWLHAESDPSGVLPALGQIVSGDVP